MFLRVFGSEDELLRVLQKGEQGLIYLFIYDFSIYFQNSFFQSRISLIKLFAMTDIQYGILSLEDFSKIVQENPSIGGPVYFEVAKSAVNNLATATQDISNLTQAFFFALTR